MVGKFSLGSKASPSRHVRDNAPAALPPHQDAPHQNVVHRKGSFTTTAHAAGIATSTTSTHFFSLPLWKRRGSHALSTVTPVARLSSDELGLATHRSSGSTRNKALPPTPSASEEMDLATLSRAGSSREGRGTGTLEVGERPSADIGSSSGPSSVSQPVQHSPVLVVSTLQPTVTLARAALGLGLPHVMPGSVSASSSTTDLHSIPIPPTPPDSHSPQSTMRRAKSFHPDLQTPRRDNMLSDPTRDNRRARGLSIGPFHFSPSDKGKERAVDTDPDGGYSPPSSKPLSRKSSFWSRKRVDSEFQDSSQPTRLTAEPSPRPSLPTLQPISPFYVDTNMPARSSRTPGPPTPRSADLRRRHSERTRSTNSKHEYFDDSHLPDVPSLPPATPRDTKTRRPKRPKTADSATTSPRLAFFHDVPRVITSSPPPFERSLPEPEDPAPKPPSPPVSPTVSSPSARPRSQTNPPLLHRLSMNLFGTSPTSHTPHIAPSPLYDTPTYTEPLSASPSSSRDSSRPSLSKRSLEIPKPNVEEESPEEYLHRLTEAVSKSEVAIALASSADPFHARALRAYIEHFNFRGDPLDVAVRKLLMDVGLPRETQQIDRVIEAFAARYVQCNPNLYTSEDHPYILAFSLIMLHTDVFNKHNKRKMTKVDYMKNTRLPGVPPEVLDCFYDNIVFAPFIFIEDPVDANGHRGTQPDPMNARRMSVYNIPPTPGSTTLLGKSNKIDPYYLIARDLLNDLRVNVAAIIPPESPYFYKGTGGSWDEEELLRAFTTARAVAIATEGQYGTTPFFGLSVSGGPGPLQAPVTTGMPTVEAYGGMASVRVTKVGLLQRKDDTVEGGRRAMTRKWREWCVLLTGSHLLFFRDPSWAASIQAMLAPGRRHAPQPVMPQPDEYVSVKDCIAVFDKSYAKHPHTLRLVLPDGRHYLLQAHAEQEMNEWISCVNYASAFKTAGLRMRALGMANRDIELTGIAAAASHMREIQHRTAPVSPRVHTWYGGLDIDLQASALAQSPPASAPARKSSVSTESSSVAVNESSAKLFKATFDQVKTELAASSRWSLENANGKSIGRPRTLSLESSTSRPPPVLPSSQSAISHSGERSRRVSRSDLIRRKLHHLEEQLATAQTQLETDMRLVRNLAVLTPFQRATRERVQVAVQGAAKRIMQARLDLEKLVCHRDVLVDDLQAGERDWERTKRIAMRAATDQLASQEVGKQQQRQRPRTATSSQVSSGKSLASSPMSMIHSASTSAVSQGRDSSVGEDSFHSAQSSVEWQDLSPGCAAFLDARGVHDAHSFDSPVTSPLDTSTSFGMEYPFPDVHGQLQPSPMEVHPSMASASSSHHASDEGGHEKFYTAPEIQPVLEEQAEEWNKTRAAKRVSLVKVPPDLRISVLFGKHGRSASESISEATATAPSSPISPEKRTYGRTMETFTMLDV
ncbi:uncharacterized protein C8Q71DRAFT_811128 [Rhodofomes roseus]|uniref:Protein transport protein sec73 n=1 Tax=Rhodofomes roseus TaxID=34475 RepID=A0ABQ8KDC2_9APHY|nr:uncharacterized protein C8Q71DRAFT_811128 [Rhodofomes roseus]KAH9835647.1 hypothetical protein C8Q71DRAFT_811128 [Rhodofomes roseus]